MGIQHFYKLDVRPFIHIPIDIVNSMVIVLASEKYQHVASVNHVKALESHVFVTSGYDSIHFVVLTLWRWIIGVLES